jgi:hypothetical protein
MKVEAPVYDIEKIEFCQTHPVFVDGSYLMVRNFPKSMAKDCLSLKLLDSPRVCRAWLDAVGQGGLSLTGGVPIYQDFYRSYIRIANSIPIKKANLNSKDRNRTPDAEIGNGMLWLSRGMSRQYQSVSCQTRHSFYLAFGITPDQQVAVEEEIRDIDWVYKVKDFGHLVHLPKWA